MELKEIEKKLEYYFPGSHYGRQQAMELIQAYGKEQYNQALADAAENADVEYMFGDEWQVDKQSILNLKKH